MEFTIVNMVLVIKDNGRTPECMDKALLFLQVFTHLQETLLIII
jgi:hypothetical protein